MVSLHLVASITREIPHTLIMTAVLGSGLIDCSIWNPAGVLGEVEGINVNKELAWSPDSGRIAFNDSEGKFIRVISLKDGSVEDISTGLVDTQIYHLDWSPVGSKLVFSGWTGGEREFWVMENFLQPDARN